MPGREGVEAKGRRYLVEGRLIVTTVDASRDRIEATCRGAGEVYQLGHDRGGWWCTCPARTRCSHLTALTMVTACRAHQSGRPDEQTDTGDLISRGHDAEGRYHDPGRTLDPTIRGGVPPRRPPAPGPVRAAPRRVDDAPMAFSPGGRDG